jgi:DNA-3-methyladenine glycosylase
VLEASFFDRDSHEIARDILGKLLVRNYPSGRKKIGRIVEVEVYQGFNDQASHASRKKTKRNEIMFSDAGHYYVYMIYGMYHCLNIVTEDKDYPAALLIRALEPISDTGSELTTLDLMDQFTIANGPGKLCRWLDIDGKFNGKSVENESLFLDEAAALNSDKITKTKRIGVNYAGKSADLDWRYYIKNNKFVSKKAIER